MVSTAHATYVCSEGGDIKKRGNYYLKVNQVVIMT